MPNNFPFESEVKETAVIIYLMMIDQKTNDSFGTFFAWLKSEFPTITHTGAMNMYLYAQLYAQLQS